MSQNSYGLDIFGGAPVPPQDAVGGVEAAKPSRAVLVQIKDIPALVKAQGGGLGELAVTIAPDTIAAKVFDTIKEELAKGFKEKGVNADVQVVVPAGFAMAGPSPVWKPVAIAALGTGGVYMLYRLVSRLRRR